MTHNYISMDAKLTTYDLITLKHFRGSNTTDIVFFIHFMNTCFFPLSEIPVELLRGPYVTRMINSLRGARWVQSLKSQGSLGWKKDEPGCVRES